MSKNEWQSMPKESYEDYILWLLLNFCRDIDDPVEVMCNEYFMSRADWKQFVDAYYMIESVMESFVAPLRSGSGTPLGHKPHG